MASYDQILLQLDVNTDKATAAITKVEAAAKKIEAEAIKLPLTFKAPTKKALKEVVSDLKESLSLLPINVSITEIQTATALKNLATKLAQENVTVGVKLQNLSDADIKAVTEGINSRIGAGIKIAGSLDASALQVKGLESLQDSFSKALLDSLTSTVAAGLTTGFDSLKKAVDGVKIKPDLSTFSAEIDSLSAKINSALASSKSLDSYFQSAVTAIQEVASEIESLKLNKVYLNLDTSRALSKIRYVKGVLADPDLTFAQVEKGLESVAVQLDELKKESVDVVVKVDDNTNTKINSILQSLTNLKTSAESLNKLTSVVKIEGETSVVGFSTAITDLITKINELNAKTISIKSDSQFEKVISDAVTSSDKLGKSIDDVSVSPDFTLFYSDLESLSTQVNLLLNDLKTFDSQSDKAIDGIEKVEQKLEGLKDNKADIFLDTSKALAKIKYVKNALSSITLETNPETEALRIVEGLDFVSSKVAELNQESVKIDVSLTGDVANQLKEVSDSIEDVRSSMKTLGETTLGNDVKTATSVKPPQLDKIPVQLEYILPKTPTPEPVKLDVVFGSVVLPPIKVSYEYSKFEPPIPNPYYIDLVAKGIDTSTIDAVTVPLNYELPEIPKLDAIAVDLTYNLPELQGFDPVVVPLSFDIAGTNSETGNISLPPIDPATVSIIWDIPEIEPLETTVKVKPEIEPEPVQTSAEIEGVLRTALERIASRTGGRRSADQTEALDAIGFDYSKENKIKAEQAAKLLSEGFDTINKAAEVFAKQSEETQTRDEQNNIKKTVSSFAEELQSVVDAITFKPDTSAFAEQLEVLSLKVNGLFNGENSNSDLFSTTTDSVNAFQKVLTDLKSQIVSLQDDYKKTVDSLQALTKETNDIKITVTAAPDILAVLAPFHQALDALKVKVLDVASTNLDIVVNGSESIDLVTVGLDSLIKKINETNATEVEIKTTTSGSEDSLSSIEQANQVNKALDASSSTFASNVESFSSQLTGLVNQSKEAVKSLSDFDLVLKSITTELNHLIDQLKNLANQNISITLEDKEALDKISNIRANLESVVVKLNLDQDSMNQLTSKLEENKERTVVFSLELEEGSNNVMSPILLAIHSVQEAVNSLKNNPVSLTVDETSSLQPLLDGIDLLLAKVNEVNSTSVGFLKQEENNNQEDSLSSLLDSLKEKADLMAQTPLVLDLQVDEAVKAVEHLFDTILSTDLTKIVKIDYVYPDLELKDTLTVPVILDTSSIKNLVVPVDFSLPEIDNISVPVDFVLPTIDKVSIPIDFTLPELEPVNIPVNLLVPELEPISADVSLVLPELPNISIPVTLEIPELPKISVPVTLEIPEIQPIVVPVVVEQEPEKEQEDKPEKKSVEIEGVLKAALERIANKVGGKRPEDQKAALDSIGFDYSKENKNKAELASKLLAEGFADLDVNLEKAADEFSDISMEFVHQLASLKKRYEKEAANSKPTSASDKKVKELKTLIKSDNYSFKPSDSRTELEKQAFDNLTKAVVDAIRKINNSTGTEQIDFYETLKSAHIGDSPASPRGVAAKKQDNQTSIGFREDIRNSLSNPQGKVLESAFSTLVHEITHAMQNEFARLNQERPGMLTPFDAESNKDFASVNKVYDTYSPEKQAVEFDAHLFAFQNAAKIAELVGVTFTNLKESVIDVASELQRMRKELDADISYLKEKGATEADIQLLTENKRKQLLGAELEFASGTSVRLPEQGSNPEEVAALKERTKLIRGYALESQKKFDKDPYVNFENTDTDGFDDLLNSLSSMVNEVTDRVSFSFLDDVAQQPQKSQEPISPLDLMIDGSVEPMTQAQSDLENLISKFGNQQDKIEQDFKAGYQRLVDKEEKRLSGVLKQEEKAALAHEKSYKSMMTILSRMASGDIADPDVKAFEKQQKELAIIEGLEKKLQKEQEDQDKRKAKSIRDLQSLEDKQLADADKAQAKRYLDRSKAEEAANKQELQNQKTLSGLGDYLTAAATKADQKARKERMIADAVERKALIALDKAQQQNYARRLKAETATQKEADSGLTRLTKDADKSQLADQRVPDEIGKGLAELDNKFLQEELKEFNKISKVEKAFYAQLDKDEANIAKKKQDSQNKEAKQLASMDAKQKAAYLQKAKQMADLEQKRIQQLEKEQLKATSLAEKEAKQAEINARKQALARQKYDIAEREATANLILGVEALEQKSFQRQIRDAKTLDALESQIDNQSLARQRKEEAAKEKANKAEARELLAMDRAQAARYKAQARETAKVAKQVNAGSSSNAESNSGKSKIEKQFNSLARRSGNKFFRETVETILPSISEGIEAVSELGEQFAELSEIGTESFLELARIDITDALNNGRMSAEEATQALEDLESAEGQTTAQARGMEMAFNAIKTPVMFTASAAALTLLAGAALPVLESMSKLNKILNGFTQETVTTSLRDISEVVLTTGADIASTNEMFGKFLTSTVGTSLEDSSSAIFASVAKYGTAVGASNDELSRGFLALQQIASKGKVSLEELNGQLAEAIPGATTLAAKGLGLTKKELIENVAAGNIFAEELLPSLARELERTTTRLDALSPRTLTQELAILKNKGILGLSEGLKPLYDVLVGVIGGFNDLTSTSNYYGVMAGVTQATVLLLATTVVTLGTSMVYAAYQAVKTTVAFQALGTAVKSTALPILAITIAISAVATAIKELQGQNSEILNAKGLDKNKKELDAIIDRLNEINRIQKEKPNNFKEEFEQKGFADKAKANLGSLGYGLTAFGDIAKGDLKKGFNKLSANESEIYNIRMTEKEAALTKEVSEKRATIVEQYKSLLTLQSYGNNQDTLTLSEGKKRLDQITEQKKIYDSLLSSAKETQKEGFSTKDKTEEFKQTVEAFRQLNPTIPLNFDYSQGFESVIDQVSMLGDEFANEIPFLQAQLDDLNLDELDSIANSLVMTMKGLSPNSKEYVVAKNQLKEINDLREQIADQTRSERDAQRDINKSLSAYNKLRESNKNKTDLAANLAEAQLLNKSLLNGDLDINGVELERKKIQAASHAARMKQIKEEMQALNNISVSASKSDLLSFADITGNIDAIRGGKLQLDLITDADLAAIESAGEDSGLSQAFTQYVQEYNQNRTELNSEFLDAIKGSAEINFEVRSQFKEADQEIEDASNDLADRTKDAVKSFSESFKSSMDNLKDIMDSLDRDLQDVESDRKKAQSKRNQQDNNRAIKQLRQEFKGSIFKDIIDVVQNSADEAQSLVDEQLDLGDQEISIKREFEDGVKGINQAFAGYLDAFRNFQDQLAVIAQDKAKNELEKQKQNKEKADFVSSAKADFAGFEQSSVLGANRLVEQFAKGVKTNGYKDGVNSIPNSQKLANEKTLENQKIANNENAKHTAALDAIEKNTLLLPETLTTAFEDMAGMTTFDSSLLEVNIQMRDTLVLMLEAIQAGGVLSNTPGQVSQQQIVDRAMANMENGNNTIEKLVKVQEDARSAFNSSTDSAERERQANIFADAGKGIAAFEKKLESSRLALTGAGYSQFNKVGDSRAQTQISDTQKAFSNKYGFGVLNMQGSAAEESKKASTVSKRFNRNANGTYSEVNSDSPIESEKFVQVPGYGMVTEKYAMQKGFIDDNTDQGVVIKAKESEAIAKQQSLADAKQSVVDFEKETLAQKAQDNTVDENNSFSALLEEQQKNLEDFSNKEDEFANSVYEVDDTKVKKIQDQLSSLSEKAGGDLATRYEKALKASKSSDTLTAKVGQKGLDNLAPYLPVYKKLTDELQKQQDLLKERQSISKTIQDIETSNNTEAVRYRRNAIQSRLADRYVNQDDANNLAIEDTQLEMKQNYASDLAAETKRLEDAGMTNTAAFAQAKINIESLNKIKFKELINSLDTVSNKLKDSVGSAFSSIFSINPSENITDQILGIVNNIASDIQNYAAEKLGGFLQDALFGSEDEKTPNNTSSSSEAPAQATAEVYKADVVKAAEIANAGDEEAAKKRSDKMQEIAGYSGGATMLAGGLASGNKKARNAGIGMLLGTLVGSFFGQAGIGGSLGGAVGGLFAEGGDTTAMFQKERNMSGKQPMLAVVHKGEEIISTKNNEAEKFRAFKKSGLWSQVTGNYAYGGSVGLPNSSVSTINNSRSSTSSSNTNVTNNIMITATDSSLIKRTSEQLESRRLRKF